MGTAYRGRRGAAVVVAATALLAIAGGGRGDDGARQKEWQEVSAAAERCRQAGRHREALPLCERALSLCQALHPKEDHADLANSLSLLGAELLALGEGRKALPYFERALAVNERVYAKQDHPLLANSLSNVGGVLLLGLGDARKALPYHERSVAMCERLYPKRDQPDLALYLNNMGATLQALGEPRKALTYFERALAVYERVYPGQDHPILAQQLNFLGHLLLGLGEPRKALPYYERGLAMRERLYPQKDHPELALSLNNMGCLLEALGEPRRAVPHHERALAMRERLYAKQDHPDLAQSLNNMGHVLLSLGEGRQALSYHERALAMKERLYPKQDHPDLVLSLHNIGALLAALGEPRKALAYSERALAMSERLYPKQDHPDLARSLNHMAYLLDRVGEPRAARPYFERALAMRERLYPKQDHRDLAESLDNMGHLLLALGEVRQSQPYYERALAMYERLYPGQDHPDLALCLSNMGYVRWVLGEPREALTYHERSLGIQGRYVDDLAATAPEARALAFAASLPRTRDTLLSLTRRRDDSDARAYAAVWDTKAAVTRVLQRRHLAARAATAARAREAWLDLADTRRRLARLLREPAPNGEDRDREVARLTARKEKLERDLAALLPDLGRRQERDRPGPDELARRLPAGTAFLDFVRYTAVGFDPARPGWEGQTFTPSYAAFILIRGKGVKRVELGPARPIDEALAAWRRAIDGWRADLRPDAQRDVTAEASRHAAALRRLVWDPLAGHVPAGTMTLYLSPDGDLARLPWAALPTGKSDRDLLDDYLLAVVPHGPFLLDRLRDEKAPAAGAGDTLVAYGGVDYADPPAAVAPSGARGPLVRTAQPAAWPTLPGTESERQRVVALAEGALKDRPVSRGGRDAGTVRLLEDLPRARYAHLATHGFFAADQLAEERRRLQEQMRDWRYDGRQATAAVGLGVRSPLAYTGLVLAGANVPDRAGPDGGVLTGEALVELPLEGLRLCVLSACDTGLGELTEGEGVYGLVRAFHLAGCPDVVASLWQVNDRATAALMAKFHHELWVNKRPPVEALREAQLLVSRRPDLVGDLAGERGRFNQAKALPVNAAEAPPAAGPRLPPKLWAAFVLSGPGRPGAAD